VPLFWIPHVEGNAREGCGIVWTRTARKIRNSFGVRFDFSSSLVRSISSIQIRFDNFFNELVRIRLIIV
jgi:hypothetical protein